MNTKKTFLLLLGLLAGCSNSPPTPPEKVAPAAVPDAKTQVAAVEKPDSTDPHADIPEIYKPFFRMGITVAEVNEVLDGLPYDSITLEQREGSELSLGERVRVTLYKSGKAEMTRQTFGPKLTTVLAGEVNLFDYGKLCYALDRLRFNEFKEKYDTHLMHSFTTVVIATTAEGPKRVDDRGPNGPIELWIVQELANSIRHRIDWKPKP
jgi:hypothetical protein